jgi:hypothetical protein
MLNPKILHLFRSRDDSVDTMRTISDRDGLAVTSSEPDPTSQAQLTAFCASRWFEGAPRLEFSLPLFRD